MRGALRPQSPGDLALNRMIGKLVGLAVAATAIAGCLADPYYGDRRHGGSYNRPHGGDADYNYGDRSDDDWNRRKKHDRDDDKLPTVVCASKDGRPNRCRTDFRIQRAQVDKRYSGSPCDYGRSWGYDGHAIWVDRGCRARFVVTPAGRWR